MKRVLIDTNLFVLFVVGAVDKSHISKHRRTKQFTEDDFDGLVALLKQYQKLWITSHCMAESSNLLRQSGDRLSDMYMNALKNMTSQIRESHIPKDLVSKSPVFIRFGVTDAGIFQKSKRVDCSITSDFDLYLALANAGRRVINFHHLRGQWLLKD